MKPQMRKRFQPDIIFLNLHLSDQIPRFPWQRSYRETTPIGGVNSRAKDIQKNKAKITIRII